MDVSGAVPCHANRSVKADIFIGLEQVQPIPIQVIYGSDLRLYLFLLLNNQKSSLSFCLCVQLFNTYVQTKFNFVKILTKKKN